MCVCFSPNLIVSERCLCFSTMPGCCKQAHALSVLDSSHMDANWFWGSDWILSSVPVSSSSIHSSYGRHEPTKQTVVHLATWLELQIEYTLYRTVGVMRALCIGASEWVWGNTLCCCCSVCSVARLWILWGFRFVKNLDSGLGVRPSPMATLQGIMSDFILKWRVQDLNHRTALEPFYF